jgi:hypothetical protein
MVIEFRGRVKINADFRRAYSGWICLIRGFKTAGIAGYFEDFEAEDRAKAV